MLYCFTFFFYRAVLPFRAEQFWKPKSRNWFIFFWDFNRTIYPIKQKWRNPFKVFRIFLPHCIFSNLARSKLWAMYMSLETGLFLKKKNNFRSFLQDFVTQRKLVLMRTPTIVLNTGYVQVVRSTKRNVQVV